jgi:hypothetical protein
LNRVKNGLGNVQTLLAQFNIIHFQQIDNAHGKENIAFFGLVQQFFNDISARFVIQKSQQGAGVNGIVHHAWLGAQTKKAFFSGFFKGFAAGLRLPVRFHTGPCAVQYAQVGYGRPLRRERIQIFGGNGYGYPRPAPNRYRMGQFKGKPVIRWYFQSLFDVHTYILWGIAVFCKSLFHFLAVMYGRAVE